MRRENLVRGRKDPEPPRGTRGLDPHLVSLVAPASIVAERYRMLRARLETRHEPAVSLVLGVTSASLGEGKTTTAVNLAGALAQGKDSRVLLVDADLRRPSVGRLLGLGATETLGLADAVLEPGRPLEDFVRRRFPFNLAVLSAGRPCPTPYEILRAPRFAGLIEEARQRYHYVVVDAPPILPVPDARLIERRVDGWLVVVAAHRTRERFLEEALDQMHPDKVIGLVLNGEARPLPRYAGYGEAYTSAHDDARPAPKDAS